MKYLIALILLSCGLSFFALVVVVGALILAYNDFKEHPRCKKYRRMMFKLYHKTKKKHSFTRRFYKDVNYKIPEDKEFFIYD